MERILAAFIRYSAPLLITFSRSVIADILLRLSLKVGEVPPDKSSYFGKEEPLRASESPMLGPGSPPISTDLPVISPPATGGTHHRPGSSDSLPPRSDSAE